MARRRYVSTTISQDTRVNKLAVQCGDFAALLYTWMIPHAADDATLPGDPEELLYQILPGRRDKTPEDVLAALDGMAALGLIAYTPEGRISFPSKAFYKYQTYIKDRNKHRDGDAPETPQPDPPSHPKQTDSANQRKSAQNTVSFSPSSSSSFLPSPSPSVRDEVTPPIPPTPQPRPAAPPHGGGRVRAAPKPATLDADQRRDFEEWYRRYPNKQHRPEAERAWRKLNPDDDLIERLASDVVLRQRGRKWSEGYIEHPATYLNNRVWEDDIEPVRLSQATRAPNGYPLSNEQAKAARTLSALKGVGGHRESQDVPGEPLEARYRVLGRDHAG